jgi:hypothetical protein
MQQNKQFHIIARTLTLRQSYEDIMSFDKKTLQYGILGAWIAGMGRYWDNPKAELLQKLGVGSVIYIFVMAALLWLVILPFRAKNWLYIKVLTFVSLTSFPAIIYAIPVEKFVSMALATKLNSYFLLIVATWRVLMLFKFFKVLAKQSILETIVAMLLPICGIIVILTILNLEKVVFDIMAGFIHPSSNDGAYAILIGLTIGSIYTFPFLAVFYLGSIFWRYKTANVSSREQEDTMKKH